MEALAHYEFQDEANGMTAPFAQRDIEARVFVKKVEGKGRCLFTRHSLNPGDVIFIEAPLLSVTPEDDPLLWASLQDDLIEVELQLPIAWHFAVLYSICNLSDREVGYIRDKWRPDVDPDNPIADAVAITTQLTYTHPKLTNLTPTDYECLVLSFRYNCFGHHSSTEGLSIFNTISMMSHSCDPSVTWHYGDDESFILRARKTLQAGEELSISYIGDDDIFKSTDFRRDRLAAWEFVCQCPKCTLPIDAARGIRCPQCTTGTCYFTTEVGGVLTSATNCHICSYTFSSEKLVEYMELEKSYLERIEECEEGDIEDSEWVLEEASRMMTFHIGIFELHTKLFEAYKQLRDYDSAVYHQEGRLKYIESIKAPLCFAMAWMHEELADNLVCKYICGDLSLELDASGSWVDTVDEKTPFDKMNICTKRRISRHYEMALNILLGTCGDAHSYTLTANWKLNYIASKLPDMSSAELKD